MAKTILMTLAVVAGSAVQFLLAPHLKVSEAVVRAGSNETGVPSMAEKSTPTSAVLSSVVLTKTVTAVALVLARRSVSVTVWSSHGVT